MTPSVIYILGRFDFVHQQVILYLGIVGKKKKKREFLVC